MIIFGVGFSSALDSSAESIDVEAADISDLESGNAPLTWEHRGPNSPGASPNDIVGKIVFAKKIFGPEDCDDEIQKQSWEKVKLPMVFFVARLLDTAGHPGAIALAAIFRDSAKHKEPTYLARFSVEGIVLEKKNGLIKKCIAKCITVTTKPCNKTCFSGVLVDENPPPGFEEFPEESKQKVRDILEEIADLDKSEPIESFYTKLGSPIETDNVVFKFEDTNLSNAVKRLTRTLIVKKILAKAEASEAQYGQQLPALKEFFAKHNDQYRLEVYPPHRGFVEVEVIDRATGKPVGGVYCSEQMPKPQAVFADSVPDEVRAAAQAAHSMSAHKTEDLNKSFQDSKQTGRYSTIAQNEPTAKASPRSYLEGVPQHITTSKPSLKAKLSVASDEKTHPDTLHSLIHTGSLQDQADALWNPSTRPETIHSRASSQPVHEIPTNIAHAIVWNPKTSPETLKLMEKHPHPEVAGRATNRLTGHIPAHLAMTPNPLEPNAPRPKLSGVSLFTGKQASISDPKGLLQRSELKASIMEMTLAKLKKAMSAGSTGAAPGSLTGGAALSTEHLAKKVAKNQVKAALRDFGKPVTEVNKSEFKQFLKSRLQNVDPEFVEYYADLADKLKVE